MGAVDDAVSARRERMVDVIAPCFKDGCGKLTRSYGYLPTGVPCGRAGTALMTASPRRVRDAGDACSARHSRPRPMSIHPPPTAIRISPPNPLLRVAMGVFLRTRLAGTTSKGSARANGVAEGLSRYGTLGYTTCGPERPRYARLLLHGVAVRGLARPTRRGFAAMNGCWL